MPWLDVLGDVNALVLARCCEQSNGCIHADDLGDGADSVGDAHGLEGAMSTSTSKLEASDSSNFAHFAGLQKTVQSSDFLDTQGKTTPLLTYFAILHDTYLIHAGAHTRAHAHALAHTRMASIGFALRFWRKIAKFDPSALIAKEKLALHGSKTSAKNFAKKSPPR